MVFSWFNLCVQVECLYTATTLHKTIDSVYSTILVVSAVHLCQSLTRVPIAFQIAILKTFNDFGYKQCMCYPSMYVLPLNVFGAIRYFSRVLHRWICGGLFKCSSYLNWQIRQYLLFKIVI